MADDAGALLVRTGLLKQEQLVNARRGMTADGGTLGEYLVLHELIEDDTLTSFYHHRLMVPLVGPNSLARIPQNIIDTIPADMAAEFRVVPVHMDRDNNLTLAMSDPTNTHAVDEIGFFTGKYVVRAVATQRQLAWCLAHYYGIVTRLGETLLQPAAPDPSPQDGVPKPIRDRPKNLTAKVNQARHHAVVPNSESGPHDGPYGRPKRQRKERSVTPATAPMSKLSPEELKPQPDDRPELKPRSGELDVHDDDAFKTTDSLPRVILEEAQDWADDAVVMLDQHMKRPAAEAPADDDDSDTAEDVVAQPVPEPAEDPASEVVLLQRKKRPSQRRRQSKRTRLGIGVFGASGGVEPPSVEPPSVEPNQTASPEARPAGKKPQAPAAAPPEPAEPAAATPEQTPLRNLGEALSHASTRHAGSVPALVDDDQDDTVQTPTPEPGKSEKNSPENRTGKFERIESSMEEVDDGWGPPGTTIPPPFLGAVPDSDIDDGLGEGAIPIRTSESTGNTLKLVRPSTAPHGVATIPPAAADDDEAETPVAGSRGRNDAVVRRREFEDSSAQLVETLRDIDRADSRDAVILGLLNHMEQAYDEVCFFSVQQGALRPWTPKGKGAGRQLPYARLPLDKPSTFQDVVRSRLPYSGALTDETSESFLRGLLGRNPGRVLILPLTVKERVVGVLCGSAGKRRTFEEHLSVTARAAGLALERILKQRRR